MRSARDGLKWVGVPVGMLLVAGWLANASCSAPNQPPAPGLESGGFFPPPFGLPTGYGTDGDVGLGDEHTQDGQDAGLLGWATLFRDKFEKVAVGAYPTAKGWQMMTSGQSASVSDAQAWRGTRSFELAGLSNWSRCDYVQLDRNTIAQGVAYEASVYLAAAEQGAQVGFGQLHGVMLPMYNSVVFSGGDGKLYFSGKRGVEIGTWEPNRWYRIRVEVNYTRLRASIYVDGARVASGLATKPLEFTDSLGDNVLDQFALMTENFAGGLPACVAYFDNIRVDARSAS